MDRKAALVLGALVVLLAPSALQAQQGDPYTLETIEEFNGGLKALWMDIQIEQIEALTVGEGRLTSRLHYQPFRWVANDARRLANGTGMTFLVDGEDLAPSGLKASVVEAGIAHATAAWTESYCFRHVGMTRRTADGSDPDIFDGLLGYGGYGDYRIADIVHAGWMPPSFFDDVAGPGAGATMLAISVTFIYVGADGQPTDINGDGFLDTAHNEVYYNAGFSWLRGGKDLESVVLHEVGHSLGLGHMDPPLQSVMNPVYSGLKRTLRFLDGAALCAVWAHWPR